MKGIDVSENNEVVDWQAVAAAGMKFAMVRSSYGQEGQDEMFVQNVEGAKAEGLLVGAYHYGYGLNVEQAIKEAQHCQRVIAMAGVLLEFPVFYDMEDADGYKQKNGFAFNRAETTAMCKAFLDNIGLHCGVYASLSWLTDYIDWRSLECPVWSAQWDKCDDFKGWMWQYTDNLVIGGHAFDGNVCYSE